MSKQDKKASKFLSLVLRHAPETIDIELSPQGWTEVSVLLDKMKASGHALSFEDLKRVVDKSDKQRFALSKDQTQIRANQGHSVNIELEYTATEPPEFLYHGTATRFIESILKEGLNKGNRHHVHLSPDTETALKVGQRHGKPVLLQIKAQTMYTAGHEFQVSLNGVWLTEYVPIEFLGLLEN